MRKFLFALPFLAVLTPLIARAHEVYVLTPQEIATDVSAQPFDMVQVALQNLHQFIFWGFIAFVAISTIFFISIFRPIERLLNPFFLRARHWAPTICRVTVGLGLLAGAYYQASFGPELPYAASFGILGPAIRIIVVALALCFISGMWVRPAAFVALLLFGYAIYRNGIYMLTYTNYLGEFLVIFLLASHVWGKRVSGKDVWARIASAAAPYEVVIVRVAFGISLFYSALYAKILHNNLALDIASLPLAGHAHGIAYYFGFEPHFMVLGAAIIEILIAVFFILGIEIRWTCIFLEFWLALSLWYFGESVWPHLILIGIPVALFFWGYDHYSLEARFFKRGRLEPVL
jgi:hypothetical protein